MNPVILVPESFKKFCAGVAIFSLLFTSLPVGAYTALAEDIAEPAPEVPAVEVTASDETPSDDTPVVDGVDEEVPSTPATGDDESIDTTGTSTTPDTETSSTTPSDEGEKKGVVATVVEKASDLFKKVADIFATNKEVTLSYAENGIATIDTVELGVTYVAPQNSQVKVTFTSLPEVAGSLSIEEVTLTDEQVLALGALSNVAYDITSSMENGTFAYDLQLPLPAGAEETSKVLYAESLEAIASESVEEVANDKVVVSSDVVSVNSLDHFTIFVVVPSDIVVRTVFSSSIQGWSMVKSGNANIGLATSTDFGVPNNFGSHVIKLDRTGNTSGPNRAFLGYFEDNLKLRDIEDVKWNVYSKTGTDTYLNIYLRGGFLGLETASVVFAPSTTANTWSEKSLSSASSIQVRNGSNPTFSSLDDLMNSKYKNWSLRIDDDAKAGITIVSGSTGNGGPQEHYVDGITLKIKGEEKVFDFVNKVPLVINACVDTDLVHTTDFSGWDLSQTRSAGTNELTNSGLRVKTVESTGSYANEFSKAAGYYSVNFPLSEIGVPDISIANGFTGARPSLQIGIDKDNNGTWDGYLVYEPWAYGAGNYWSSKDFGVSSGGGYTSFGPLQDYLDANPDAQVISIGYSLGSGVVGDAVITKLTVGCVEYTFGLPPNELPEVTIDIPAAGQFVSTKLNGDKLRVTGTFTDDKAVNYAQLELVRAGNLVTLYTMHYSDSGLNPDGTFSVDIPVTGLVDGTYSLFYVGTDFDGGVGPRLERVFTIDNTAPTAPSIIKPTPRQWFKTAPIATEWTSATDPSGVTYQVAYAYDDGHAFGGSTCTDVSTIEGKTVSGCRDEAGTSRGHNPTTGEQGGVTVWVRAIDGAGNVSSWSSSVHYFYDAEAPVTTLVVPTGIVGNTFTVSGSATDNLSLNRVYVQLVHRQTSQRYGGTTIHLSGTAQDWSRDFDVSSLGLPEGDYAAHVTVVDNAGNTSSVGWSDNFTLDITAPDAPVHESPADNSFQNFNDFYFQWTDVSDAVEYEFQSSQNPSVDSNGVLNTAVWNNKVNGGSDRNFLTASEIHSYGANGTWYWQVRAIDAAGNKSAWTSPWKMTIDMVAPAVPTGLAWNDSNNNNVAHNGITNSYEGFASWDAVSDASRYVYKYWNDIDTSPYNDEASSWRSDTSGPGIAGVFNQGEGKHYFCVVAVDLAGNESACSEPFAITYDATAPVAPTLTNSPVYVNLGQANNQATWSHPESGVKYEYREYLNQSEADADADGNTSSYWIQYKTPGQTSQTVGHSWTGYKVLYYRVVAIDEAGNRSLPSELGTVIIDKVRPTVSLVTPTSTGPFANSVTIQVDANDNHGLSKITANIYQGSTLVKSTFTTIAGNATGTHSAVVALPNGNYVIRYNASDVSGTFSTTTEFPFTIADPVVVPPVSTSTPTTTPSVVSSVATFGSRAVAAVAGAVGQVLGASTFATDGDYCVDPYLTQNLGLGHNNSSEQVTRLQNFLNRFVGTALPVTGFFGPLTQQAVMTFQSTHAADILAPWGLTTPTGFVYHTTIKKINELTCDNQKEFPLTQAQQDEIEGRKALVASAPVSQTTSSAPSATGSVAGASTSSKADETVKSDDNGEVAEDTATEAAPVKKNIFQKIWGSIFGN